MNGAEALVGSLAASGVTTCFANPGTSELHVVSALGAASGIRGVLCLFEGVATGAADGFARMAGVPGVSLLHQGAGLANGLACLHNAGRAGTPTLTVVGDGATTHRHLDAPLASDVAALAATTSGWVRTSTCPSEVGADAAAGLEAATRSGAGAVLVVPADVAWGPGGSVVATRAEQPAPDAIPGSTTDVAAERLRAGGAVLLLGGPALRSAGLAAAARIGAATGATVLTEAFPARMERGTGRPAAERLAPGATAARARLAGARSVVLAGVAAPVAAFATPGEPGELVPEGAEVVELGGAGDAVVAALEDLADALAPGVDAPSQPRAEPPSCAPSEPLTAATVAAAVAAWLPDGAVLVDEANTSGAALWAATAAAAPHDVLAVSGFAIGHGMPLATGAALACPERPVACLEADGSAMYTASALWTQAREGLDVTSVVLANRRYAILHEEAARRLDGRAADAVRSGLFDLSSPNLDFVALATAMGVPAARARSAGELAAALALATAEPGPHLIEAEMPTPAHTSNPS